MRKKAFGILAAAVAWWLPSGDGRAQIIETPASSVTGRTIQAIGYVVGGGSTSVDLKSTGMITGAGGRAKVEAKPDVTTVDVNIQGLKPPRRLGGEFLRYVAWAVSPQGRAINLGGIAFGESGRGMLHATTQLQGFSLFVTAEPYSAVRQPSEMVILENAIRKGAKGKILPVHDYKLMKRSLYEKPGNPPGPLANVKNMSLEMNEARNAVDIARASGAESYAPDLFSKAAVKLKMAEKDFLGKARQEAVSAARQAGQFAEDARALSVERKERERIATEHAAVAAQARPKAEAELTRKAAEEVRRQAELAGARQAQFEVEGAARESKMNEKSEVAAAAARAEADAIKTREEAAKAEIERAQQAAAELRAHLLDQFNRILETRDSPRGLVVTMEDVLFVSGTYDLRPDARESLASLARIILAHPGLNIEVEGHPGSALNDQWFNQKLSALRALTVRSYLMQQGMPRNSIVALGFGKELPVAESSTVGDGQMNRRVELTVSGEIIMVKIGK